MVEKVNEKRTVKEKERLKSNFSNSYLSIISKKSNILLNSNLNSKAEDDNKEEEDEDEPVSLIKILNKNLSKNKYCKEDDEVNGDPPCANSSKLNSTFIDSSLQPESENNEMNLPLPMSSYNYNNNKHFLLKSSFNSNANCNSKSISNLKSQTMPILPEIPKIKIIKNQILMNNENEEIKNKKYEQFNSSLIGNVLDEINEYKSPPPTPVINFNNNNDKEKKEEEEEKEKRKNSFLSDNNSIHASLISDNNFNSEEKFKSPYNTKVNNSEVVEDTPPLKDKNKYELNNNNYSPFNPQVTNFQNKNENKIKNQKEDEKLKLSKIEVQKLKDSLIEFPNEISTTIKNLIKLKTKSLENSGFNNNFLNEVYSPKLSFFSTLTEDNKLTINVTCLEENKKNEVFFLFSLNFNTKVFCMFLNEINNFASFFILGGKELLENEVEEEQFPKKNLFEKLKEERKKIKKLQEELIHFFINYYKLNEKEKSIENEEKEDAANLDMNYKLLREYRKSTNNFWLFLDC